METNGLQGIQVGGREPKALLMNDGTRLSLEEDIGPGGRADWTLVGDEGVGAEGISVGDALRVAGDQYADYVRIRTRAEIAWLRLVSEWFDDEAKRLDRDLAAAGNR
ncbi:MAG: hypothetical protein ACRDK5_02480 [Solirubrobacterales bacterium]